jgi:hypothetical protein
MNASTIVQKLWNYCNVLRDDGMRYGDCVEQLTCLLFLRMADERCGSTSAQSALAPLCLITLAQRSRSERIRSDRPSGAVPTAWK